MMHEIYLFQAIQITNSKEMYDTESSTKYPEILHTAE